MAIRGQSTEDRGQIAVCRCAALFFNRRGKTLSSDRGFSLIEMMISITIGLMIIGALAGVLTGNARSNKTNERTTELNDNGRFALDHLKRELLHAGYRGYTPKAPESSGWTTPTIVNECGTAGSFVKNIRQGVWGADDYNPFSGSCLPSAKYNNTINSDVLVIRHADSTPTEAANLASNTLYLRSNYSGVEVKLCSLSTCPDVAGFENAALHVQVYYIGFADPVANVPVAPPALRRVSLQGKTMLDEMIASGIEQLQIEYGVNDAASGTTQYFTANNVPNSGSHSATGATGWDKVTSVRFWLLARNIQSESGYSNTSTYEMGNRSIANHSAYTVNDSFRRQLYTAVVQLRNFR